MEKLLDIVFDQKQILGLIHTIVLHRVIPSEYLQLLSVINCIIFLFGFVQVYLSFVYLFVFGLILRLRGRF
jgi:hypothetical protein